MSGPEFLTPRERQLLAAVRKDEQILLERAREALTLPGPDYGDLWQVSTHTGVLKHLVAELAAALELRRDAELR